MIQLNSNTFFAPCDLVDMDTNKKIGEDYVEFTLPTIFEDSLCHEIFYPEFRLIKRIWKFSSLGISYSMNARQAQLKKLSAISQTSL